MAYKCIDCGVERITHNPKVVRCRKCRKIFSKKIDFKGSNSNAWNGGRSQTKQGYIKIYMPNHPHSINGYVLEHRIVVENSIGRLLVSGEIVHHKNRIKNDNRLENLELLTTHTHVTTHKAEDPNYLLRDGGKHLTCIKCGKIVWKCKYYVEHKYKDESTMNLYKCLKCGGGGRKSMNGQLR